jgi:hypothetical protein
MEMNKWGKRVQNEKLGGRTERMMIRQEQKKEVKSVQSIGEQQNKRH